MNKRFSFATLLTALAIYVGSFFVGSGVFNLLNGNEVFSSTGQLALYLYLLIGVLSALATCALLSLAFRNISLVKAFPGVSASLVYISLVFYFGVYKVGTIIPLVLVILYALYCFSHMVLSLDEPTSPDGVAEYLSRKHPNTYILSYLGAGILVPTVLIFLSFVPLYRFVQVSFFDQTVGFTFSNGMATAFMIVGLGVSYFFDICLWRFLYSHPKGTLYKRNGIAKFDGAPQLLGDLLFLGGIAFYLYHYENLFYFAFAFLLLWVYVIAVLGRVITHAHAERVEGYADHYGISKRDED